MNPLRYLFHSRDKPKDSLNGSRYSFFFGGTSSEKHVLLGMMDNIYIRPDPAGNIKPDKENSAVIIDGTEAAIMVLDRILRNGRGNSGSIYNEQGLLIL